MSVNFNDDTKKPIGQYFGEGVHKVKIQGVVADTSPNSGSEYFEFGLLGENGEEGNARVYWTEKSQPYSFNTIRDIFVHNTKEENKDKVRDMVNATSNTDELLKLCQDSLEGKEAWLKVEKSGTTYVNGAGETKESYNRNIYGYEPRMTKKSDDEILEEMNQPIDTSEIPFN